MEKCTERVGRYSECKIPERLRELVAVDIFNMLTAMNSKGGRCLHEWNTFGAICDHLGLDSFVSDEDVDRYT